MTERDDIALLREFAATESEAAFAALVSRHVSLVCSAALRSAGNAHAAQEITQAVFIILAKKAKSLGAKTVLSGWLCQTTRLTAANYLRGEVRRQQREQKAYMQSLLNGPAPDVWPQIAPLLDDALAKLGEADRNAIVLRYFENKNLREVGAALGASEDAAKMRVNRALEKLRKIFAKRGVALSAMLIAGAVSANSVQAAPAGLAAAVMATATKGTLVSATLTTLVKATMKTMTWLKIKYAAGVGVAALLAVGVVTMALSGGAASQDGHAVAQSPAMLIVPGASVGPVQKGMTTNEVEAVLGKPDNWQGKVMLYDENLGMSVVQSRVGVVAVFCGDALPQYPGVKKFKGRTKEGIGMESTREEIIKAFGQPTTAKPWSANPQQEQLEYRPLGLVFLLEKGKVFNIVVDFRGR